LVSQLLGGEASVVGRRQMSQSHFGLSHLRRMSDFMRRHPQIDLRIHPSPEPVDFFRTDTDVEIRYGNADWTGLVVRPLFEDRILPLVAPSLLERVPRDPAPSDLLDLPLIHSGRALMSCEDWFAPQEIVMPTIRGRRFDFGYLVVQAVALGPTTTSPCGAGQIGLIWLRHLRRHRRQVLRCLELLRQRPFRHCLDHLQTLGRGQRLRPCV
jgi:LysR family transcriptional regulator, glycine cleavage system transcriptional activator